MYPPYTTSNYTREVSFNGNGLIAHTFDEEKYIHVHVITFCYMRASTPSLSLLYDNAHIATTCETMPCGCYDVIRGVRAAAVPDLAVLAVDLVDDVGEDELLVVRLARDLAPLLVLTQTHVVAQERMTHAVVGPRRTQTHTHFIERNE